MTLGRKILVIVTISIFVVILYFLIPNKKVVLNSESIVAEDINSEALVIGALGVAYADEEEDTVSEFLVTHVSTPESVKAIYMSSWVAGTPSFREKLIKIADETEVNSIVIDIKDYTGKVSFRIPESRFEDIGSTENRIPDVKEFIGRLHEKNIYVIGRISVFQDPYLVKTWPDEAVKKNTDKTLPWKDHKGISWIDAGSEKVWEYTRDLAKISYEYGFDEINFDYIRFPSDGNMKDIYFPYSDGRVKSEVVKSFFEYVKKEVGDSDIKTSADIFGMTTTNTDDLNIGQVLEHALANFDYVAPMVYPSHFPNNWAGLANPAEKPYDVIFKSMGKAVERAIAMGEDPLKLRPWLQDFDLGADYTAELVRAQMTATYDIELNSWMLWDPKNIYTRDALLSE